MKKHQAFKNTRKLVRSLRKGVGRELVRIGTGAFAGLLDLFMFRPSARKRRRS